MTDVLPVAVVIPCFKVRRHIAAVLAGLEGRVRHVYVIDDACPEGTGLYVRRMFPDVRVLWHRANQGVGGAVLTGYAQALADGHQVIVKMDGDGQMDPGHLAALVEPVLSGTADYAKGNRFFGWRSWGAMPWERLVGNVTVSMVMKAVSGYPRLMDPTNGYTAVAAGLLRRMPLERVERRWFFECDMLFRLSALGAVIRDVPIPALYADEVSGLDTGLVLREFPRRLAGRTFERLRSSRFRRVAG